MTDKHLPSDPIIRSAWDELSESLQGHGRLLANESAFFARDTKMTPIEQVVFYALKSREPWESITIHPQHRIGKYVADFLVEFEFSQKGQVVVECDGHDFHERTKEQAQHDKKRDRELQALGFKVYRFTGSEIWKTRGQCVLEALEIACG